MEEEDSHYCLRCRTTIQGLENYIQHRREKCVMLKNNNNTGGQHSSYLIAPRNGGTVNSLLGRTSYQQQQHHHLGLTSTPSKGSGSDPVLSSSSNHMEAERFKHRDSSSSADHHLADLSVEVSADDFMNHLGLCMVSSANWATELGHPEEPLRADDFFSLLELQSCSRVNSVQPANATSSQTQRQRQRRSNELMISPSGEDRFKSSLVDEHHTTSFSLINESADLNTTRDHDSSGTSAIDLGNGSGGDELTDSGLALVTVPVAETIADETMPFPSRGKWMPGLKPRDIHKSGSSVEYHCKPCNRRLTGRVVFEKHLQSELHFKRTAAAAEEPKQVAPVVSNYGLRTTRKKKKMDGDEHEGDSLVEEENRQEMEKKKKTVDVLQDDDDMWWLQTKEDENENKRRCSICDVWVPTLMFGRHLLSRFHYTRSRADTVQRDIVILENISDIVMMAPFQCRPCRFYCHSHHDLLVHWGSPLHLQTDADAPDKGSYFCSLCGNNRPSCQEMRQHLESPQHLHCVEIVNKSVATVISRPILLECHMCVSSFRYRIQLNRHLISFHALPAANFKCPKLVEPQRVFTCDYCPFKSKAKAAFTHHLFNCKYVPKEEVKYRCLICNLSFNTRDEVVRHRSTQEHRDKSKSRRSTDGLGGKLRSCQHCYQSFPDLTGLKNHLLQVHVNLLPRCPNCLTTFALKQELSAHRRAGCQVPESEAETDRVEDGLVCDVCSYVCRSRYDLLYHKAIGHQPEGEEETKYQCPDCGHYYSSIASLKVHLQLHDDSRTVAAVRCNHCSRYFSRQEDLDAHIRQLHVKLKRRRQGSSHLKSPAANE